MGEETIDDLLHAHGIPHDKEPRYPGSNYRGDFLVGNVFIEFFDPAGDADYDAKTKRKQRLCRQKGIELVSIYPKDVVSARKL